LPAGGRFVAELGGKGNVGTILEALRAASRAVGHNRMIDPWFFPTVGEYASILERHGLNVTEARLFDRLTPLDGGEDGMREWIQMFAGSWLAPVPESVKPELIEEAERSMRATLYRDGQWMADYRRLRVVAIRD
jgi:hypothetical protein